MRVSLRSFATFFALSFFAVSAFAGGSDQYGNEDPNKKVLKQGLLGAGVGAVSAQASGGKAGTGALVGAGTNVIGGALLDTLTASPKPAPQPVYAQQQPVYAQQAPPPPQYVQSQPYYADPPRQPVYAQQPVYYQQQPPAEDPSKKILKQGLLGAGTGAIAAGASGGKAGKGALIGAGTNVIGGALLDMMTTPSQPAPQPVYYQQPQQQQYQQQPQSYYNQGSQPAPKKKIVRKYNAEGKVISEEEIYE